MSRLPLAVWFAFLLAELAVAQRSGWRVAGKVTDAAGEQVPGVRVASSAALEPVPCADGAFDVPLAAAPWSLESQRTGLWSVSVAFLYVHPPAGWVAPQYSHQFGHHNASHAPPRATRLDFELVRGESAPVRGVLLDAAGRPVPDTLLVLRFDRGHTVARTDAAGRFATAGALPSAALRADVYVGGQFDVGAFQVPVEHDARAPVEHTLQVAAGPRVPIELLGSETILARRSGLYWHARLRQRHADGRCRDWSWRRPIPGNGEDAAHGVLCYPRAEFPLALGFQTWVELEAANGLWSGIVKLPADPAPGNAPVPVSLREHPWVAVNASSSAGELQIERIERGKEQPGLSLEFTLLEVRARGPFEPRPTRAAGGQPGRLAHTVPDPGRYRVTVRAPGCRPEVLEVEVGDDNLEVGHLLLLAERAADAIAGTVEAPLGGCCPLAVVHLESRVGGVRTRLSAPAVPSTIVRTVNGKCLRLADATQRIAHFCFTDVPPGEHELWVEPLDQPAPANGGAEAKRTVRAGMLDVRFVLPLGDATPRGWSITSPHGVALDHAPIALQSPDWPMPVLYDVPLGAPLVRWDRTRPFSFCIRVPGCQPVWGGHETWTDGSVRAAVALAPGWGFELVLREGRADGAAKDSARERWRTLVDKGALAGVGICFDGVPVGTTDAGGRLRVWGTALPKRWSLRREGLAAAGHQGWMAHDVEMLFDAPQVIWRMIAWP